jgi:hypothetical protein
VSFDVVLVLATGKVTLANDGGDRDFSVDDAEAVKFALVCVSVVLVFADD